MGFDGKTLIHPNQIAIANETFGPSPAEITEAQAHITAYEEAIKSGAGIAVLDGKLIEELHIQDAKRILALATTIASFSNGPEYFLTNALVRCVFKNH